MNWLNTLIVLLTAFVVVFWEAALNGLRYIVGAQLDLLPALMVYAALQGGLPTVCLLALAGGLWFDALSANPLGVTVLPLLTVGATIFAKRDLILRDQPFAQFVLGLAASALAPALTLVLLLTTGHSPLFGWGTLWQLIVMSLGGAVSTPVFFALFAWLNRVLVHSRPAESSFRPDREIRRGRG